MSDAGTQFSDGKAYERLMGRWSRVIGEKFLDWLPLSKGFAGSMSAAPMAPSLKVMIARSAPAAVSGNRSLGGTARLCAQAARREPRAISASRRAGLAVRRSKL